MGQSTGEATDVAVIVCLLLFLGVAGAGCYFFFVDNFELVVTEEIIDNDDQQGVPDELREKPKEEAIVVKRKHQWRRAQNQDRAFYCSTLDPVLETYFPWLLPGRRPSKEDGAVRQAGNDGEEEDDDGLEVVLVSTWSGNETALTEEMRLAMLSMGEQLGREPTIDELFKALGWKDRGMVERFRKVVKEREASQAIKSALQSQRGHLPPLKPIGQDPSNRDSEQIKWRSESLRSRQTEMTQSIESIRAEQLRLEAEAEAMEQLHQRLSAAKNKEELKHQKKPWEQPVHEKKDDPDDEDRRDQEWMRGPHKEEQAFGNTVI